MKKVRCAFSGFFFFFLAFKRQSQDFLPVRPIIGTPQSLRSNRSLSTSEIYVLPYFLSELTGL